ncbi:type VI secretion system tip protein TssI/VgrG [Pseudomonas sp. RTC3]|uniref:type VI secretion system Vgr family protein n=1 Tax=unclassified Pseudomonas TaxID=196821 RepID=UPI002AB56F22|nr:MULTISPECIES: type VI secretion system tip protein TssI/VgrG [unclassified Pseudomonas]MEB0063314.1 type VI secretion system tip protein TssI/VgrG [Pseudomonas sp. RTC3]MDY7564939.1 type VI secretion system tip protein TssI/VgrG [Pseudomonas sp. 5C2]MEB0028743.1 type VI secretion system tip protein TssI/VgrG [Pseudomonas sp. MH9.2]MEB0243610.1 type VI secretion system tip protein TssI/VgrG [Pseudomonas sp. 5C2]WPX69244.1 type VI secretion system tip protein TssI/VgrG [Pseudomonas sp. MH9.2]
MSRDNRTLTTLTIAHCELALQVISFKGHEALNEPYRFDIDLISPNPHLDFGPLLSRSAYLSFDALNNSVDNKGIHGLIAGASLLYAGTSLSHYRVHLAPRMHVLLQRSHRRIFQALSAPQIIVQLLEEHGIDGDSYRFEHMIGLYPPRSICVQYDENDLHLLQRLCEEEGIHYRFEHRHSDHVLIFSDDPGSFPEQPTPIRFHMNDGRAACPATISHMAKRFSIPPSYSSQGPAPIDQPLIMPGDNISFAPASDPAVNQPCESFRRVDQSTPEDARIRQLSERTLERLRCERRLVHGQSNQPTLVSGQIQQVFAHPDNLFNDQWLLTEVHHAGKQLQLLNGFDPLDIAAIFDHDPASDRKWWEATDHPPGVMPGAGIAPFSQGYRNHFRAIPWTQTFRPQLKHCKPHIPGGQTVTLVGVDEHPVQRDEHGQIQVRFHWHADIRCWVPLASHGKPNDSNLSELTGGSHMQVRYFDNDPDRPVICGHPAEATDTQVQPTRIRVDGHPLEPVSERIHLSAGQTLHADAGHTLMLDTHQTRIVLQRESIQVTGPQSLSRGSDQALERFQDAPIPGTAVCREDRSPYGQPSLPGLDLRLTEEPGLLGQPLAHRIWYIVRMDAPSLKNLARLAPQHFLFDGKTDHRGFLGLDQEQLQQLAVEYRKTPQRLCLVHPGSCQLLSQYFQQNWTSQQLLAFSSPKATAEPAPPSPASAAADLSALFQWLSRP